MRRMFRFFRELLFELRRLNDNLEYLPCKLEKIMSAATDNLAKAIQRRDGLDQQLLSEIHDLVTQNQSLSDQIKAASNDPQVQALADQINANSDQIATTMAASAPITPAGADAPQPAPIPAAPLSAAQTGAADRAAAEGRQV